MRKKGIIPKFKKKLTAFLTEEAGSIRRENILSIGAAALMIAGSVTDQADAYLTGAACHTNHTNAVNYSDGCTHTSGTFHSNSTPAPMCMHENYSEWAAGGHGNANAVNALTAGSDSKLVNWHYNQVPSVGSSHVNRWHANISPTYYLQHYNWLVLHSSHSSHSDGSP